MYQLRKDHISGWVCVMNNDEFLVKTKPKSQNVDDQKCNFYYFFLCRLIRAKKHEKQTLSIINFFVCWLNGKYVPCVFLSLSSSLPSFVKLHIFSFQEKSTGHHININIKHNILNIIFCRHGKIVRHLF